MLRLRNSLTSERKGNTDGIFNELPLPPSFTLFFRSVTLWDPKTVDSSKKGTRDLSIFGREDFVEVIRVPISDRSLSHSPKVPTPS